LSSIDPKDALTQAPKLTYRFAVAAKRGYDLVAANKATVHVMALPILPVTRQNGMRAAVSIDGGPLTVLDFNAAEFTETWRQHVQSNIASGFVHDVALKAGAHTLTLYALDPGLILDRIEIGFEEAQHAYNPVPETRIERTTR
jgi:hypothetical protein